VPEARLKDLQTLSGVPAGTRLPCAQTPGAEAWLFSEVASRLGCHGQISPPRSWRPQRCEV